MEPTTVNCLASFSLIITVLLTFASADTYYVTPTSSTPCLEEGLPCFRLSEYATQPNSYFANHVILLILQAGDHTLHSNLNIQAKFNLTITAVSPNSNTDPVTVTCDESARLVFRTIQHVTIRGVIFVGCANNKFTTLYRLTIQECVFQGRKHNGSALVLSYVTIPTITRSTFSLNGGSEVVTSTTGSTLGGAIVASDSTNFTISSCVFTNNTLSQEYSSFTGRDGAGGAAVYTINSAAVTMNDCIFNENSVTQSGYYPGIRRGVVSAIDSSLTVTNCTFTNNIGASYGGAIYFQGNSDYITIDRSRFINNSCSGLGGGVYFEDMYSSNVNIQNSEFIKNSCYQGAVGGVSMGTILILNCTFIENNGGGVYTQSADNTTIIQSTFNNNSAPYSSGGAVYCVFSVNINVHDTRFVNNTANRGGGAVYFQRTHSAIEMSYCTFEGNTMSGPAPYSGGALYMEGYYGTPATLILDYCTFTNNGFIAEKQGRGAALYISSVHLNRCQSIDLTNNVGNTSIFFALSSEINFTGTTNISNNYGPELSYLMHAINSTVYFSGFTYIENNCGPLFAFYSNLTFTEYNMLVNNTFFKEGKCNSSQGGAIIAFQSDIVFRGPGGSIIRSNAAKQGGAISMRESKLDVYGSTQIFIENNTASISGGGIYAYQSELSFRSSNAIISSNRAAGVGGGIHAISSSTRFISSSDENDPQAPYYIEISNNSAEEGGGMCLEQNSKLYIIKASDEKRANDATPDQYYYDKIHRITFSYNYADYGGALYVIDDTNSGVCEVIPYRDESTIVSGECFFQVLAAYDNLTGGINLLNALFYDNTARIAGDALYGGLLDRCTLSPFAEFFIEYPNLSLSSTMSYIFNTTNIQPQQISTQIASNPVRLCFCKNNIQDCSYQPPPVHVNKGGTFKLSVVAVDQVNNTVLNVTIHSSISLLGGELGGGQAIQQTSINKTCTEVEYNVLSTRNSEQLNLYTDGPCAGAGISTRSVIVIVDPCPVGFVDTGLQCECDPDIFPQYVVNCSINTESVLRRDNSWFSYVNDSELDAYVYSQECPFDYCYPPTEDVLVNLNVPKGSDALCEFNRSGMLCGSCEDGLSLTLGSSRCKTCSNHWLAMIAVFVIAGVVLVAFLLMCNLTVADGLINGLIFYANIIAANRTIFLPFKGTNLVTVFIAWVNLDFGFETCFFDGMDGFAKVWLQLAFPTYVIILVAAIIIISEHSRNFANLFGKHSIPLLATLILLSYAKLIRVIIAVFSFATLEYSDGSEEVVWLVDGNIPYLEGKHIPLFITAFGIIIIGSAYTFLLFSWQWLQLLDDKANHSRLTCGKESRTPLAWLVSNTRVIDFMDAYQIPYNESHRYWVGLLLLVRVLLYLVSAVNVVGDTRINLLSINSVIVGLLFFQYLAVHKERLHKKWLTNITENIFILNLIGFTSITLYVKNDEESQAIVAWIFVGVALVTFLLVLVHQIALYFKRSLEKMKELQEIGEENTNRSPDILFNIMYKVYKFKKQREEKVTQRKFNAKHERQMGSVRNRGFEDSPTITEVGEPKIMDSVEATTL